jgi:hypothetical protein
MSRQQAEAIFDAVIEFGKRQAEADRKRREVEAVRRRAVKECGNCYYWMKSRDCPIDDQRRGFPSMSHPACEKFNPTDDCVAAMDDLVRLARHVPEGGK